jgi:hypothetical protein
MSNKRIIQNILRYYITRNPGKKMPLKDIKAVEAITQCQTIARGFNILSCPDHHRDKIQTHACRHRSCPICADKSRYQWIEAEKQRLIDCSHYHVIFTLPHEYLNLWQYNRKWFTRHIFKACRDTLIELMKDPKYLGVIPGLLMTLHTWGRQLNYHPHIHCLVTAGGLTEKNEWKAVKDDFLLPIRVVKSLYRGKLQGWIKAAILSGEIVIPLTIQQPELLKLHWQLYQKEWSVRIQEQYEHGHGVALYLARYMKGGPIKPAQITCQGQKITFQYKDHRDNKRKQRQMGVDEFVKKLLWHVPENGVHVVRHYGLYVSKNKTRRESYQGKPRKPQNIGRTLKDAVHWRCEECGPPMQRKFSTYSGRDYENSLIGSLRHEIVQQDVEADRSNKEVYHRWR